MNSRGATVELGAAMRTTKRDLCLNHAWYRRGACDATSGSKALGVGQLSSVLKFGLVREDDRCFLWVVRFVSNV